MVRYWKSYLFHFVNLKKMFKSGDKKSFSSEQKILFSSENSSSPPLSKTTTDFYHS